MPRAFASFALTAMLVGVPAWAGPAASDMPSEAAAPEDARTALIIESGRLVVMMDQSAAALTRLGANGAHGDLAPAAAQRAYAFQDLVAAVLHYNLLVQRACRAHLAAPERCTGPFLPVWLADPPGTDHSEAQLRRMVEEAGAHLVPFWSEVCGKGRKAGSDDSFCDLE